MIDDEKKTKFLEALTALSREHGIVIGGCGCCSSPWISELDSDGAYIYDEDRYGEGLVWQGRVE